MDARSEDRAAQEALVESVLRMRSTLAERLAPSVKSAMQTVMAQLKTGISPLASLELRGLPPAAQWCIAVDWALLEAFGGNQTLRHRAIAVMVKRLIRRKKSSENSWCRIAHETKIYDGTQARTIYLNSLPIVALVLERRGLTGDWQSDLLAA